MRLSTRYVQQLHKHDRNFIKSIKLRPKLNIFSGLKHEVEWISIQIQKPKHNMLRTVSTIFQVLTTVQLRIQVFRDVTTKYYYTGRDLSEQITVSLFRAVNTRNSPISYIEFSMHLILIGLLWRSSEPISSIYQSTRRDIPKDWKVPIFFRTDLREISDEKRSWWNGRVAGPGTGLRILELGVLLPEVGYVFVQPSSLLHDGCQTPESRLPEHISMQATCNTFRGSEILYIN